MEMDELEKHFTSFKYASMLVLVASSVIGLIGITALLNGDYSAAFIFCLVSAFTFGIAWTLADLNFIGEDY